MKGVILAGGTGSRLMPMTEVTNKHLLPVYDKPMIFHPIQFLVNSGIRDIVIVTGGESAGHLLRLLKNGEEFGLNTLVYAYQKGSGGIADALRLAKPFIGPDESMCVILGDNIFEYAMPDHVMSFMSQVSGARVMLKEVEDPHRFGVATLNASGGLTKITEKPANPDTKLAVTGVYFYDSKVFSYIAHGKPSSRGELEITDVNNHYLENGELTYCLVEGWWSDAGTPDSLLRAANLAQNGGTSKVPLPY